MQSNIFLDDNSCIEFIIAFSERGSKAEEGSSNIIISLELYIALAIAIFFVRQIEIVRFYQIQGKVLYIFLATICFQNQSYPLLLGKKQYPYPNSHQIFFVFKRFMDMFCATVNG